MNNLSKSPSPYTGETTPVRALSETFAYDYNSALLDISEQEAVESIQIVKKLLVERLNEKVFSLQQQSEQSAKQAGYISSLISQV
jgi:hypothetical protein